MHEALFLKKNICFSAGQTGRRVLSILREHQVDVAFFCDNDPNKHNTCIDGVNVISFAELKKLDQSEDINILLTNATDPAPLLDQIYLAPLRGTVFNYSGFVELPFPGERDPIFFDDSGKWDKFIENLALVRENLSDKESRRVLDYLKMAKETRLSRYYENIAIPHMYFIDEVLKNMPPAPHVVDCGAHVGTIIEQLINFGFSPKKIFGIEMDHINFIKLQNKLSMMHIDGCSTLYNAGLWNENKTINATMDQDKHSMVTTTKNGSDNSDTLSMFTLDELIGDSQVDYLKMNIEGSELMALQGALDTIENNYPIMAIALDHGFYDLAILPLFLMEHFSNYNYIIRHHFKGFTGTVLYCLPTKSESNKK